MSGRIRRRGSRHSRSVPTGLAPQLGQKAAPYLPLDARRSAPVRQDAPHILFQRMAARGLATVENVQRLFNLGSSSRIGS